ncbi:kinase-like protein [Acephala macrosclerotiorum]|nr:kinase-like protein [Acephala macrosclerotiorum]
MATVNPPTANPPARAPAIVTMPPGPYTVNPSIIDRMSQRRQFAWLERSKLWPGMDPTQWQARKVLGIGTTGLVGQWDYIGSDPNMPRAMVVKQSAPDDDIQMHNESKLLHMLTATGTNHIIKLFKSHHYSGGTGTTTTQDPLPLKKGKYNSDREVSRMYLELGEGGDMFDWIRTLQRTDPIGKPPEEHMWRVFGCLVKGLLVLETGSEDPNIPDPYWTRKIAHLDIKTANILICGRDQNEHKRLETFKLADFGMSLFVPRTLKNVAKRSEWIEETEWRATRGYMAPEQYFRKHHNRDIGTKVNVWSIGASMWEISEGNQPDINTTFNHRLGAIFVQVSGNPSILYDRDIFPYSQHYIDTLAMALAYDPALRASPSFLLRRIQTVIDMYITQTANDPIDPDSLTKGNIGPGPLPNQPFPGQRGGRFQEQRFPAAVSQRLDYSTNAEARDYELMTPTRPDLPDLLFSNTPFPPQVGPYPFTRLPATPRPRKPPVVVPPPVPYYKQKTMDWVAAYRGWRGTGLVLNDWFMSFWFLAVVYALFGGFLSVMFLVQTRAAFRDPEVRESLGSLWVWYTGQ